MSSHIKLILAAALILGTASAAPAESENNRDQPGSASQAERDWRETQQALFRNHIGNGGAVYDYIGSPHQIQSRKSR